MSCSIESLKMLLRFANASSDNLQSLQDAYDAIMLDVLSGKGAQVLSASSNGASFTFAQGGSSMTNLEWATCLSKVLEMAENGGKFSKYTIARVH